MGRQLLLLLILTGDPILPNFVNDNMMTFFSVKIAPFTIYSFPGFLFASGMNSKSYFTRYQAIIMHFINSLLFTENDWGEFQLWEAWRSRGLNLESRMTGGWECFIKNSQYDCCSLKWMLSSFRIIMNCFSNLQCWYHP